MKYLIKNKMSGFTLIELLVVIAIIGLLSSAVFASLNSARAKSRDVRRIRDLKQIQTALEIYYDTNKQYPQPSQGWGNWSGHCPTYGNNDNYITGLAPTSIPILPRDPLYDSGSQCYVYRSETGGQDYMILAYTTMETIVGGDPSAAGNSSHIRALDRVCCIEPTIGFYTPGARNW
jgi:prepilin-type N-terminal cleavage/methylation domain-containing protein